MIVDPWGTPRAALAGRAWVSRRQKLDLQQVSRVREAMPVLQHRRPGLTAMDQPLPEFSARQTACEPPMFFWRRPRSWPRKSRARLVDAHGDVGFDEADIVVWPGRRRGFIAGDATPHA